MAAKAWEAVGQEAVELVLVDSHLNVSEWRAYKLQTVA